MTTIEQVLKQLRKIKKEYGNIEVCLQVLEDDVCHYCSMYPRDYRIEEDPILTVKNGKVIISEY